MPSTLAWLDHDAEARDRTRRILALFQEEGTRDQLGLGGIRDSLSDLLFPGTSTIQTRLRYFLLVPWVYERLEEDAVPAMITWHLELPVLPEGFPTSWTFRFGGRRPSVC